MGNTATGAQNVLMLGLEQQIPGYNVGAPLPFTTAAAPPGAPTTALGSGTGITAASLKYGLRAWIKGRGLTAIGTKSTPALAPSNKDVTVTWSALAAATGCYGYRVERTTDDGTTWTPVADVWGRTTVTYTDAVAVGSEPEMDAPVADDETILNHGLVQVSASPAPFFDRKDGEFNSDELTGYLGEPDAIPGFMTVPAELPFDMRAGVLVPIEATFSGKPTETALTGAPGMQYDFAFAEDEEDQVSLWGLEYPGGATRPAIGSGIKYYEIEFSDLGKGIAKVKAKGMGTGWTEAGLALPPVTPGTYLHVPVVKGQRGDAGRFTDSVFVKIIDAPSAGTFTFKAKIGALSAYGGSGTLMTGYYDTTTGKMILGGTNDEPFVELVDETGAVLGIDDDENREPFSIYFPGNCALLEADKEYEIPPVALVPRALKSISDTTSTGDVRRIVRLPRFGPAHVKFLKTVDSVQSKFEFESATLKLSRTGTPAYQPGASAKRPVDVDITGFVGIELSIDARYKTREIERMQRENTRFAVALEITGGRIPSAPGVLSSYREAIYKTFAWCRIASFSAPPTGPGLTKSKVKLVASQPPDGSAFMPLNRIVSRQTWPFHSI